MRLFYFVTVMLILHCFMACLAMTVKNLTTDQYALLAFKAHVVDPWSVLSHNWSNSYPVCSWVGISCGIRHHRVTALNLLGMGLEGTIPPHLGNLSFLVSLNFSRNNFHGHPPNELGQLRRLRTINFSYNKLSGSFPSWIGVLPKLQTLIFRNNSFTGHILISFFNLSKLEWLDSRNNIINGNIPSMIGNLSRLMNLKLADNNLQGEIPTEIGNLQYLESLLLSGNNLTGPIPSTIFNNSHLINISLMDNQLSGHLPSTLGLFLPNIEFISLSSNNLIGTIPNFIINASKLSVLSLSFNSFSGLIPNSFGNLRHLRMLTLENNYLMTIEWSFLSSLTNCRNLSYISLASNPLSGILPPLIGNFSASLHYFYAYDCKLSGSIPQEIGNLRGLILLNLDYNDLNGTIPTTIGSLQQLQALTLKSNNLQGSIPNNICHLGGLYALWLEGNKLSGHIPQFQGHIPESLGSLTSLESLDLSSNNLSGEIPKSLEALSQLKHLNVSHNSLEGEIPTNGPFKNFSAQSFIWNHALCGLPRLQVPPCKGDKNKGSKKIVILVLKYVLPVIMSIGLIVIVIIFFLRRRNKSAQNLDQKDLLSLATWRRISFLDIQRATDGFNESNLLGTGSFGSVYKGTLLDRTNVAIKVFNLNLERAFRSFDVECEVLRNIRHRNLVKILSCCCNRDFKALVLEFMPNDSLEKWLYSQHYFLDIIKRLNMMIDVGLALEYLHHGHSPPVVHCDLKPSNILLDENLVAHVSDFGISKLLGKGDDSVRHAMTMATIGYMAPEYGLEGIISSKCDVYSYGILLMETFTRKKPTDEMFFGEMSLKNWVEDSLPHGLIKIVDANLLQEEQHFPAKMDCLLSIMHLALECCVESPNQRIYMTDAATKLKNIKVKFLNDVAATN